MHGLSPEEEIDYWRERARRAEAELAHEREMTAARKIVHRAARNVDRAEDLATIQRESARVNEQGGVIAHLVGVLAEVMRATTVENARTFAEIALSNIEAWHAGAWTPGPHDDAADWKPGHHRARKETR